MTNEVLTPADPTSESAGMTQTMKEVKAIEAGLKSCGVSVAAFLRGNAKIMGQSKGAYYPVHQTTWAKWKRGASEPTLGVWREVLRHYERIVRNHAEWRNRT